MDDVRKTVSGLEFENKKLGNDCKMIDYELMNVFRKPYSHAQQ